MATVALKEKQAKPKHDACETEGGADIRRQRYRWLPLIILMCLASALFVTFTPTLCWTTC